VLRFDRMENMIVIEDFSPLDRTAAPSQRSYVLDGPRCPIAFSPGYGMVRR
jgi:hypothetical protein